MTKTHEGLLLHKEKWKYMNMSLAKKGHAWSGLIKFSQGPRGKMTSVWKQDIRINFGGQYQMQFQENDIKQAMLKTEL